MVVYLSLGNLSPSTIGGEINVYISDDCLEVVFGQAVFLSPKATLIHLTQQPRRREDMIKRKKRKKKKKKKKKK